MATQKVSIIHAGGTAISPGHTELRFSLGSQLLISSNSSRAQAAPSLAKDAPELLAQPGRPFVRSAAGTPSERLAWQWGGGEARQDCIPRSPVPVATAGLAPSRALLAAQPQRATKPPQPSAPQAAPRGSGQARLLAGASKKKQNLTLQEFQCTNGRSG